MVTELQPHFSAPAQDITPAWDTFLLFMWTIKPLWRLLNSLLRVPVYMIPPVTICGDIFAICSFIFNIVLSTGLWHKHKTDTRMAPCILHCVSAFPSMDPKCLAQGREHSWHSIHWLSKLKNDKVRECPREINFLSSMNPALLNFYSLSDLNRVAQEPSAVTGARQKDWISGPNLLSHSLLFNKTLKCFQ